MKSKDAPHESNQEAFANGLVRGVAILAVITLHILAVLPPITYHAPTSRPIAIAIDQLCRFCVPVFVALSGYGFWKKYSLTSFSWPNFIFRQGKKLLPMYFLASTTFYVLFHIVPPWIPTWSVPSFPVQLLTGQADYHLYFVPMIFQFYLLFPVFFWLMKKAPLKTLVVTAALQSVVYFFFSAAVPSAIVQKYFLTDLQQYFWFMSWMFYFVLGMYMQNILKYVRKRPVLIAGLGSATVLAWGYTAREGLLAVSQGVDPIIAMRFTQLPVMLYATLAVVTLMCCTELFGKPLQKMLSPLIQLGKQSYPIYLFHTIFVRLLVPFVR